MHLKHVFLTLLFILSTIFVSAQQWSRNTGVSPNVTYPSNSGDNVSIPNSTGDGNKLYVSRTTSNAPLGWPNVASISAYHNYTATGSGTTGQVTGFLSRVESNASRGIEYLTGVHALAETQSSHSGAIKYLYGFNGSIINSGSGTITNGEGIHGVLHNVGTIADGRGIYAHSYNEGSITHSNGIHALIENTGGASSVTELRGMLSEILIDDGSVSDVYGIDVSFDVSAGTIADVYGLKLDAVDFGSGDRYSIYGKGGTVLFEGDAGSHPDDVVSNGRGVKMAWIPGKRAFRAGEVSATTIWNALSVGDHSWAGGLNAKAEGDKSFAFGHETHAQSDNAVALGYKTEALAHSSFTANELTKVEASYGSAFNYKTEVAGEAAAAFGYETVAEGHYSFVNGRGSSTTSMSATVIGQYNSSTGGSSTNWVGGDPLFVVGNGIIGIPPSSTITPSDAFKILKNGQTYIYGPPTGTGIALTVSGDVDISGAGSITGGVWAGSDSRYKKNIKDLESATSMINNLRGVSYDFDQEAFPEKGFSDRKQFGFLAQEMKEVCPNLVKEDEEGFYSVNYDGVIPILVEAVKEQQDQIEIQEQQHASEMDALRQEIQELKTLVLQSTHVNSKNGEKVDPIKTQNGLGEGAVLYQNAPNPFGNTTAIGYTLPDGYMSATIKILDITKGVLIKEYQLTGQGNGSLEVQMDDISSGSYVYSLLIDGKLVDTKTMILSR